MKTDPGAIIPPRLTKEQEVDIQRAFRQQYSNNGTAYADLLIKNWADLTDAANSRGGLIWRRQRSFGAALAVGTVHTKRLSARIARQEKNLITALGLLRKTTAFINERSGKKSWADGAFQQANVIVICLQAAVDAQKPRQIDAVGKQGDSLERIVRRCLSDELRIFFQKQAWPVRARPTAAFYRVLCVAFGQDSINRATIKVYTEPLRVGRWELETRTRRGEVVPIPKPRRTEHTHGLSPDLIAQFPWLAQLN